MSTSTVYEVNYDIAQEECKAFEGILRPRLSDVLSLPGVEGADVLREDTVDKPTVVFVLGGPGAGKGTQCAKIVEDYGYTHISAGDCLRAERATGSADADLINSYIKDGKIVPVEITIKLVLKAMDESGNSKFLIDGFPRDLDNLAGWNRIAGAVVDTAFVMYFDCPEDTMLTRLLRRGETSGRVDDNITSIRKRFFTYQESTQPVIQHFESLGKIRTIKADRPVELVYMDVQRVMDGLEESLKERTKWTVLHRMRDDSGLDGCMVEHDRFVEELQKIFPGNTLKVTSRVLRKVADDTKAAEGGCTIA